MNTVYPKFKKMDRRHFLTVFSSLGLASTLLPGALAGASQGQDTITTEMMKHAEKIAGLEFSEQEREEILQRLNRNKSAYGKLRNLNMDNQVPLSLYFNPVPPGKTCIPQARCLKLDDIPVKNPERIEDTAFYPITHLSMLIKEKKISSTSLTSMYLARLKRYDPLLKCVVTITEDLAMEQADRADREIASGNYRGPLHGIPWGVKDLFATKGIPTTWGLELYKNRVIDTDATVVKKLETAGAVLIAKLSLGELASGDRWYGGRTRNPWNRHRGSGGSSAGSASAVAAGLVGFSIGTETNESLVGPAMLCGVNGLRPTFGRVSRYGAMTVSWSFDKIGPMCRSAEDCAVVLDAIGGPDCFDHSVADMPFNWDPSSDMKKLRIGYIKEIFDLVPKNNWIAQILASHKTALNNLKAMGADIIEIKDVKHEYIRQLTQISSLGMMVEAAAAHEELTFGNSINEFRYSDWPRRFRSARYVPAVDFIQANRARTLLIHEVEKIFRRVDVLIGRIVPSALQSNITGHPELVIPHGLNKDKMPLSIILTGKLFGEAEMLSLAHYYQMETGYHQIHPDLDA